MRKQEVDSLRGRLILNSKDRTLDLGIGYIKRNLCTYNLTWFLGCKCMQPSSWNAVNVGFVSSNAKGFEPWKLWNAHAILPYSGDLNCFLFSSSLFFVWKNTNWLSLSKRCDNSYNLILSSANLFGDSLRVYVLFDLVTWQFWSDVNGVVWHLINQPKYWS